LTENAIVLSQERERAYFSQTLKFKPISPNNGALAANSNWLAMNQ